MARKCDLCGRGSTKDASRSHSNIKTTKRQHINLQAKNVAGTKLKVCTKCIKTVKKYNKNNEK
jgi:ribosomal protein L28